MRIKLNSIRFGTQALTTVNIFVVVLPACFYLGDRILAWFGVQVGNLFKQGITISIALGLIILLSFLLLLLIEFIQDSYLEQQYFQKRNRKVRVTNKYFECQYCGNRQVRQEEISCLVCGKRLMN